MTDVSDETKQQGLKYLQAWKALGNILRDGGSWSGHERNCCFLNTQSNQFADISSIVGLDQASDSRAIGLVDWDQDGDLDLWYSNRTAPRVRYLQNNNNTGNGYLAIRLRGTKSNRDAIGARLELETTLAGRTSTSIQTLRAGEGYLAQSSKWIHFGLGESQPTKLRIRWPRGDEQSFSELKTNTRYLVVEGEQPVEVGTTRAVELANAASPQPSVPSNLRIIPSRRMPMPRLQFLDARGKAFTWQHAPGQFTLLTIWATWCQPCISELQEFQQHFQALTTPGIRWLPVNVDEFEADDPAPRLQLAKQLLSQIDVTTPVTLATRSAVECLDVVQRVLVTKQDALPVPCSFLIDRSGHLMAVYKGTVSVSQVLRDVIDLERTTPDPRDVAIPFPGLWAMSTFPPDLMAIPTELINIGRTQEALDYLVAQVPTKNFEPPITAAQLTQAYLDVGQDLVRNGLSKQAEVALQQALQVNDAFVPARMALGEIYLRQKQTAEAMRQYRAVLAVAPRQPVSLNNLAWLLATSPDETLRNAAKAVALAEQLCALTKYNEPLSLDTLSVALAADSQFERAIRMVEKAIALAKRAGQSTTRMEARLQLFRSGKPYIEP